MRILLAADWKSELVNAIRERRRADYVYMYPPRQAYRAPNGENIERAIDQSAMRLADFDLYLHFPFCRQICAFCNLFAMVSKDNRIPELYIDALELEMKSARALFRGKKINTIYFGGGTPSLLSVTQFQRIMSVIKENFEININCISEISMEVAPDTVARDKIADFVSSGLSRVNLGVQSLDDRAVQAIGRKHGIDVVYDAISLCRDAGVKNISVDLIFGLPLQTMAEWRRSVEQAIDIAPETINLYPFTSRPYTSFFKMDSGAGDPQRYDKFNEAYECLLASGYQPETHVRFVRAQSQGGYLQKANHWSLKNVLGFGAGARSYLWDIDLRNGYSVLRREDAVKRYVLCISEGGRPIDAVYEMSDEERRRKAVALNIMSLQKKWYESLFGNLPEHDFHEEITFLLEENILEQTHQHLALTRYGLQFRDLVAQIFFSSKVKERIFQFDYHE